MKKRELLAMLKFQQRITMRTLDVLMRAYESESAEDSSPSSGIHKPAIHGKVEHIEPALEFYR
jgi:hypothetical protein